MSTRESIKGYLKKNYIFYLMLLPAVAGYIVFCYLPMFGIIIAFQNFNFTQGYFKSPWVGLTHFITFVNDRYFFRLLKNTFLLSFYSLLWGFPLVILFTLFLNEIRIRWYKKLVQTISYLPTFISVVVLVSMTILAFGYPSGIINTVLQAIGVKPVEFLLEPGWFRTIFISSGIWQNIGMNSILYFAAITSTDPQIFDAAVVDGANRFKIMYHVTFATIRPVIVINLLLAVGSILNLALDKVYLLYNPFTYEVADVFATYIYRRGIIGADYSFSTAVGLFNSVVAFVLLIFSNKIAKKFSDTSLW